VILPHLPLVPACPPSASCMAPPVGRPSPRCADAPSLWTPVAMEMGRCGSHELASRSDPVPQPARSIFVRPKGLRQSRSWDPGAACAQYATRVPRSASASPGAAVPACLGSRYLGSRLSPPGPGARVPAVALPAEDRRSACLAAGSTRRPRKRARARSGRRNTSPDSCPPAPSRHTPFLRGLCYPSAFTPPPGGAHTSNQQDGPAAGRRW
jgi:hypothetical protein